MVVIGAFARVEVERVDSVQQKIDAMPGVSTFDLGDEKKVGILVEAAHMEAAHRVLTRDLREVEGVLGVWPVYVHDEAEPDEVRQAVTGLSETAERK